MGRPDPVVCCLLVVPVMILHATDFSPLNRGAKQGRRGIARCLVWLPMMLLAVSLTLLGMLVAAPWALVAWIVTGKR